VPCGQVFNLLAALGFVCSMLALGLTGLLAKHELVDTIASRRSDLDDLFEREFF
jgi:hypothetical protein